MGNQVYATIETSSQEFENQQLEILKETDPYKLWLLLNKNVTWGKPDKFSIIFRTTHVHPIKIEELNYQMKKTYISILGNYQYSLITDNPKAFLKEYESLVEN